jgi:hypothetical protein
VDLGFSRGEKAVHPGAIVMAKGKPQATPPHPHPTVQVAALTQAVVPIYHEWIGMLEVPA